MEAPHQVLERYGSRYDQDLAAGNTRPFIYPLDTIGEAIVLLYLFVPFRSKFIHKYGAILAWTFNLLSSIYVIRYCRCRAMAPAFGLGLIKAWSILWTSTMVIVHDCKTEFQRIEAVQLLHPQSEGTWTGSIAPGDPIAIQRSASSEVRGRHQASSTQSPLVPTTKSTEPTRDQEAFAWQSYPTSSLLHRIDWVLDLYMNFRGMSWNWRIPGPPPLPEWVKSQLEGTEKPRTSQEEFVVGRDGTRMYSNLQDLLVARAKTFMFGYFVVDFFKTFMMYDSYFLFGDRDLPPPAILPDFIRGSPFLVQSYRLLCSMGMMYTVLHTLFDLGPLFFAGLLGPKLIGVRGESWVYPDSYGALSIILDKGLAGWWGGWWHQSFRFAFESTAKRIVRELGFQRSSVSAKALQLVIAFSLSGCLHACASITQPGTTHPLSGAFLFFFSQSFGIISQMLLTNTLKRTGIAQTMPKVLCQTTNLVFAYTWLYFTAPLICDDFAAGGIWLFEPIPISPLRGFGLGVEGSGWWCWKDFPWPRWHQGQHWWQAGFIF